MNRWTPWIAVVALALLAAPADAQVRFELNPYAGVLVFDDSELEERGLEVNPAAMIGARAGVLLSDRWQVEGGWGWARSSIEASEFVDFPDPDSEVDVDIHLLYGALDLFVLDPDVRTKLLLTAGAGLVAVDPATEGDAGVDFTVELGVGFTHPVNEWITFRGDLRDHLTFCSADLDADEFQSCSGDEVLNHVEISAGLEFWLN